MAQEAAEQFAIQAILTPVHDFAEIEAVITNIAADALSGLVLPQDSFTSVHRKLIVALAAHYRLPAVYAFRYFTAEGGLLSYGIDVVDEVRRAATYAQQHRASIRRHQAGIKRGFYRPAFNNSKVEAFCATLCRHRGSFSSSSKVVAAQQFSLIRSPDAPI